jgi:hypothetical protein
MAPVKPTSRPDPALATPQPDAAVPRVRIVRRDGRLIPIGPERLEALREAIRSGEYPLEENAVRGLQRLLRSTPTPTE